MTIDEVERLIEAAKNHRYSHRDALMVLLAFRHGLRAGEVCDLRWEQIDFKTASLPVRRFKNGTPSTHPLTGLELRALSRHQRESEKSPFVFVSEKEHTVLIETTSGTLSYRRHDKPALGPVGDSLDDFGPGSGRIAGDNSEVTT